MGSATHRFLARMASLVVRNSNSGLAPNYKAINHFPENCPYSPFADNTRLNLENPLPLCEKFNQGHCTRANCSYHHICLSCQGNHPQTRNQNRIITFSIHCFVLRGSSPSMSTPVPWKLQCKLLQKFFLRNFSLLELLDFYENLTLRKFVALQ